MSAVLFEDMFEIVDTNPDGKKFDRVTRLVSKGVQYQMDMLLDVNTELYKMKKGERFSCALASLDGKPDTGEFDQSGKPTLLDKFEYGMYGKLFQIDPDQRSNAGDTKITVYVSFGGLLMSLSGEQRHLSRLVKDSNLYLLIRKAED